MPGSGALGSAVGGVLTEGGNDVWLIDARASHVDAMHGHYEPGLYPRQRRLSKYCAVTAL
jgi:ketopantoate reductase